MAEWAKLTADGEVQLRVTKSAPTTVKCSNSKRAKVAYEGKLATGNNVFDSSMGYAIWFDLGAGKIVEGFEMGIACLTVGDEAEIKMSAKYGYGDKAQEGIPAGSELLFVVRIEDAEEKPAPILTAKQEMAMKKEEGLREQAKRAENRADTEARKAAAAARMAELAAKRQSGAKGKKK